MAKETVHEDFGEKIGGAKKDLWAARGLYVDDLLGMNEREADKYVKKDNVWKKPDYNALIQSGVPVDILYFRKVVRDSHAPPVSAFPKAPLSFKRIRGMSSPGKVLRFASN